MNEVEAWSAGTRAERARAALVRNGFDAVVAKDSPAAAAMVMGFVKVGASVGLGGSMTLRALGLADRLQAAGAKILDHNRPGISPEDRMEILRGQLVCDLFISSSNAVTMKGELFNVDGNGNRVAALTFGPRKTVVVVGVNKIVADEGEAWARVKASAGPMNNRRLLKENPCVKLGQCADCDNPGRICRIYSILRRKPNLSDFTVIIVEENLGY